MNKKQEKLDKIWKTLNKSDFEYIQKENFNIYDKKYMKEFNFYEEYLSKLDNLKGIYIIEFFDKGESTQKLKIKIFSILELSEIREKLLDFGFIFSIKKERKFIYVLEILRENS